MASRVSELIVHRLCTVAPALCMAEILQLDEDLADQVLQQLPDECRESLMQTLTKESATAPNLMPLIARLLRFARPPQVELAYEALRRVVQSDTSEFVRVMALDSLDWMRLAKRISDDMVREVVGVVYPRSKSPFRDKCVQVLLELKDPHSLSLVANMYLEFREDMILDGLARTGIPEAGALLKSLIPICLDEDEGLQIIAALNTWNAICSLEKVLQETQLSKDDVAVLIDSRNFSLLFRALERGLVTVEHCGKILEIPNDTLGCSKSQRQFKRKIEEFVRAGK